jgi:hypothetical protein
MTDMPGDDRLANRWATLILRFIWPVLGLGSIPGILLELARAKRSAPELVSLLLVAAAALVYWQYVCRPLRWVWMGPDGLRVSNGLHEVRLPRSEVASVRPWVGSLVLITLQSESAVGKRFAFIPPLRFWPFGEHPVIAELRRWAAGHDG